MPLLQTVKKAMATIPTSQKLVVGVSGGADSVALALLLRKLGYSIVIAHLNHGIRGAESDADEAFARQLAKRWKVPFSSQKINGNRLGSGNRENTLRQIRYGFLEKTRLRHKAAFVAVAHHRDDQIETILMHMARGAGLRGMVGMSPAQNKLIRPLLGIPKSDLVAFLKQEKTSFRTDQSNFDPSLSRNHFRHNIIPALRSEWPTLEKDLLTLAAFASKATQKTEKEAKRWIEKSTSKQSFPRESFTSLSDETQSEVLFELAGREDIYRKAVEAIKSLIHKGVTGKQKRLGPWVFRIEYGHVHLLPRKATGFLPEKPQPILGKIHWGEWILTSHGAKGLFVRSWKPGDRMKPAGMQGTKKLQDLFTDLKIPKAERHRIPIITDKEQRILAVGNLRVALNAGYLKKYLKIEKNKSA